MTNESNQPGWIRPVLYGLLTEVFAFVASMLVITVYATYLGFKARGAPHQALIGRFAAISAPWITAVIGITLAFAFARRVAKKAGPRAVGFGLIVGFSAALFDCVVVLAMRSRLGLHTALIVVFLVCAGWLGGYLGAQRGQSGSAITNSHQEQLLPDF